MKKKDIVRIAKNSGVNLIYFIYCDNANLIRGKATHIDHLNRRIDSGIGLTVGQQAAYDMDLVADIEGMGTAGEARILPDIDSIDSFVPLPWSPKRAMLIGDLVRLDMTPWACPRIFLKNQISKASDLGLEIMTGLEPEWYVGKYDPESDYYKPIENSQSFHSTGFTPYIDFIDDLIDTLAVLDMKVETYYPESGPGHIEVTVRPEKALKAADNHIFYREAVRNIGFKHDLAPTFMPKPFLDQAGAGGHIHISAWDKQHKNNLFYTEGDDYALSTLGQHFLAGVMDHLPGLMAILAPSYNSYRRFHKGSWSGGEYLSYGTDNRESAVRIPSRYLGNEMGSVNIEVKPADNSANPYLAIGSIIAAGIDGISRELIPNTGQFLDCDPTLLSESELRARGILHLPSSLSEANEALERDEVLNEAMGDFMATAYLTLRKAEEAHFAARSLDFELKRHYNKY
ncbi:MAG: glutamine synthetase family protein [SAR202 cluster bacterium]|nr:glutamine synthetase family protein [SAR202 cluster bacterium]